MAYNGTPLEAELLEDCAGAVFDHMKSSDSDAALLGSLVPVCLVVTLLSTPKLRKQWAFRLLIVALFILLATCVVKLHTFEQIFTLYDREGIDLDMILDDELWRVLWNIAHFPVHFVPFICDCALLCRLLAFHPSSITPTRKRIAILAFPLAAHIPRLPLLIAYCCLYGLEGADSYRYEHAYKPLRVAEGGLQLLVNCYCSGFLLHKTYQYARADHTGQTAHSQQAHRLRLRLRYLTESILFNFVPASLAQLGYFIAAFVELYPPYKDVGSWLSAHYYMRRFGFSFSLYFGLLAVWWCDIRLLSHGQTGDKPLVVKRIEDLSLLDWALGPLTPEEKRSDTASKEKHQALTPTPGTAADDASEASLEDAQ